MKKKILKKKNVSIDDLALMVQKGFAEQDTKLEGSMRKLDVKIEKIELALFDIKSDLTTIKGRLDAIDKILAHMQPMVSLLKFNDQDLEHRIARIEHKLGITKK